MSRAGSEAPLFTDVHAAHHLVRNAPGPIFGIPLRAKRLAHRQPCAFADYCFPRGGRRPGYRRRVAPTHK